MHAVTGWTDGLSQDYNKKLGQWFASRLGAKEQLRKDYEMTTPQYELPEPTTNAPRSITEPYTLPEPTHWHAANGIAIGYTADQLRQEVAKAEQRGRESMRVDAVKVCDDHIVFAVPVIATMIKDLK